MTAYTAQDTFEALKKVPLDVDRVDLETIMLEDVVFGDYPDFCDAFIAHAEFVDGSSLNDDELEELNTLLEDDINELANESIF